MKKWFTMAEIQDYLGISHPTIMRRLKADTIPAYRVGHQWRFDIDEIDEWIKSGKSSSHEMEGDK
jgi:excisionase family DNA binding protein